MDCRLLTGDRLDLSDYRFGTPQQAGRLTVVPITTQQAANAFLPLPDKTTAGGDAKTDAPFLYNASQSDCLLAPLHFGLPVERSRSHILSGVTLVPPRKRLNLPGDLLFPPRPSRSVRFGHSRYCCLPLALRGFAWRVRHSSEVDRLAPGWNALDWQMRRCGLGTLPAALLARNPEVNGFSHRIERITGQTGALFFLEDKPVGLEIAPSPAYFATIWEPLLTGCYGLTALLHECDSPAVTPVSEPYAVSRLTELRTEMFRDRHQRQEQLETAVAGRPEEEYKIEEEQRWRNYRVQSLTGTEFAGQFVEEVTSVEANTGEGGAMPRMLRNLFRKGSSQEERTRRRVVYVSVFSLASRT